MSYDENCDPMSNGSLPVNGAPEDVVQSPAAAEQPIPQPQPEVQQAAQPVAQPTPQPQPEVQQAAQPVVQPAPQPEAAPQPTPQPVQPYSVEDERQSWSDPVYERASGIDPDAYTPGRYAYGTPNVPPEPEEPPKKKKKAHKRHGFLRAACLVLVCALAAGAASWLVVDYMFDHHTEDIGGKQVVFGSETVGSSEPISSGEDSATLPPVTGSELTGNEIYKLACQQVVGVNTSLTTNVFGQTSTRAVSGSGFIISEDGYILTNYHVISYAVVYGGELTVLTQDGTKYPAEIIGYVESNDIAVIKIDAEGLSPVKLGDSDKMLVGEWVYAVGNPLGELEYTMTPGIVSAQDRVITTQDDITGSQTSINMFQISAAVNHGNSGGPVYNTRGEVIGVVAAKYADADSGIEGLGFAIPINDAITIAKQLVETGHVASAGLGITGMNADQVFNQAAMERYNIPEGVYVDTVNSGEAADKAGIQEGDIITALDDKTVSTMDELKMALRRFSPGETSTITVYRRTGAKINQGEYIDLTITFQEFIEEPTVTQQQDVDTWPWGNGFGW